MNAFFRSSPAELFFSAMLAITVAVLVAVIYSFKQAAAEAFFLVTAMTNGFAIFVAGINQPFFTASGAGFKISRISFTVLAALAEVTAVSGYLSDDFHLTATGAFSSWCQIHPVTVRTDLLFDLPVIAYPFTLIAEKTNSYFHVRQDGEVRFK